MQDVCTLRDLAVQRILKFFAMEAILYLGNQRNCELWTTWIQHSWSPL